ncbi:MAG: glutathione S-transferase family protein [Alphaproteobacteria bacterium]|nr:glutathione S-transferase family protein [Alphaproteobacteria bacterium]
MALTLYYHPLSSFCMKALIALYENDTAFTPHLVNLMDPADNAAFKKIWPIGKFPVLRDDARGETIPESTIIIEYLDRHYPGRAKLVPDDPDLVRAVRLQDRFFDLHVHVPMQKVVGDRLRPAGNKDPLGVDQARDLIKTACGMLDRDLAGKTWAVGDNFTMADCSAAPALFYADMTAVPLAGAYDNVARYLARLKARPSYARVLTEAEPYFKMVPK